MSHYDFPQLILTYTLHACVTMSQDAKGQEDARKRIASQMSLAEKESLADYVIYNDGPLEELSGKVTSVVDTWRKKLGLSRLFNGPVMLAATAAFIGTIVMPLLHRVHVARQ